MTARITQSDHTTMITLLPGDQKLALRPIKSRAIVEVTGTGIHSPWSQL